MSLNFLKCFLSSLLISFLTNSIAQAVCYANDASIATVTAICLDWPHASASGGNDTCPPHLNPDHKCIICHRMNPVTVVYDTSWREVAVDCFEERSGEATPPGGGKYKKPPICPGSTINVVDQYVGESVDIVGTPFSLNYSSDRMPGRLAAYKVRIPLVKSTLPSTLSQIDLKVVVAGVTFNYSYSLAASTLTANLYKDFIWDGLDFFSNVVSGPTKAVITITKIKSSGSSEYPYDQEVSLGVPDIKKYGLGGWMLNIQHYYNKLDKSLYLGDGSTYFVSGLDTVGLGKRVVSQDGSEVYLFDSSGRHLSTLNGLKGSIKYNFSYNGDGTLNTVTDAFNNVTTVGYDLSSNPLTITGPFGQITLLTTDIVGNLTSIENPETEKTQMAYLAGGLLDTYQKPGGTISTMTYDADGRLTSDSNTAGNSLTLSRTAVVQADTTASATVNTLSAMGVATSYPAATISDLKTQSITIIGPGSLVRTSEVRTSSNDVVDRIVDYTDNYTKIESQFANDPRFGLYNSYQSYLRVTTPSTSSVSTTTISRSASLATPGDPFSVTTMTNTYTSAARVFTESYNSSSSEFTTTTPGGQVFYHTIDGDERTTSVQEGSYTPVTYSYDGNGRLSGVSQGIGRSNSYNYNLAGYLASYVDPLSQTTSFTYDGAGRILTQTFPDSRVASFAYDVNGNLTSVTPPGKPAHDMTYNSFDSLAVYLSSAPTTYAYNTDRQITQITRPSTDTIDFNYNSTTGRLSSIVIPTGTYTIIQNSSYNFIDSITSPDNITQSFAWDGDLLESYSTTGISNAGMRFFYNNDMQIRIHRLRLSNNFTLTYNSDRQLIGAGDETITYMSTPSVTGRPISETLGGVVQAYDYDATYGELEEIEAKYTSTNLYKANYTRDSVGRIKTKAEKIAAGSTNNYEYFYDSSGRLTDVELSGTLLNHYEYDDNGNRTKAQYSGTPILATYNNADQLITFGSKTYSYDVDGFLSSVTDSSSSPAAVTSYAYDILGNLKSVTLASSVVYTYKYDGYNRRVYGSDGTNTKQFVWGDQLRIYGELDGSGNIVSEFVYGNKVNVPDYMVQGANKYKIVTDHLGSVRAVINESTGAVSQSITYDEFGKVVSDTNPGFQPFGFAGGLYDANTGLVRFGARDYDAEAGRWTSKDPILFRGGDTNLYGYVQLDPINFIDPYGLRTLPGFNPGFQGGAAGAIIGGAVGSIAGGIGAIPGAIVGGLIGGGIGMISGAVGGEFGKFIDTVSGGIVAGGLAFYPAGPGGALGAGAAGAAYCSEKTPDDFLGPIKDIIKDI